MRPGLPGFLVATLFPLPSNFSPFIMRPSPTLSLLPIFGSRRRALRSLAALPLLATLASAQPAISHHPADAYVIEGQHPAFRVQALPSAGAATYQWYRNGELIEGATSHTYVPAPAAPIDEGSRYHVVVSDDNGSSTSNIGRVHLTEYSSDIEMPVPDASRATLHLDAVNGSDTTGDGSAAAPFKTFTHLKTVLTGGEVVLFHAGDYGRLTLSRQSGEILFPYDDWVTLLAAPGEDVSINGASFTGADEPVRAFWNGNFDMNVRLVGFRITGTVSISNANNVRVEHCHLSLPGPFNNSESSLERSSVAIRGGRSITIEDCEITQTAHAIGLRGNDLTVRRNHIHHIAHDGIRVTGCDTVRIENNRIYNSDDGANDSEVTWARHADGIQLYKEQDGSASPVEFNNNIYIRGNRIYNHEAMTIMAQGSAVVAGGGCRNWVIENNVFGPSGGYMLHLKLVVQGFTFRHNTIVRTGAVSYQGLYRTLTPNSYAVALPTYTTSSEVEIYNNIFVGPIASDEFAVSATRADRFSHNFYDQRPPIKSSVALGDNAVTATDEFLSDPLSFDGRLVPGCAAIGAGSTEDPILVDLYGTPRQSPPTIGATEWLAETPDSEAPTAPTNLSLREGTHSVALEWTPSTDNVLVAGYEVWRSNELVTRTPAAAYTDRALSPDSPYTYKIIAYDTAGNRSEASFSLAALTLPVFPDQAAGRPATASSSAGGSSPTAVNDGALATAWRPEGSGPHWLEVDLETPIAVDRVELHSGLISGSPVGEGTVLAWVDGAWQTLVGGTLSGNVSSRVEVLPPAPVTTQRIRLETDDSAVEVNALQVFGEALDNSPPSTPTGLIGDPAIDHVALSWNPATDDVAVAEYIVFRNWSEIGRTASASFTDIDLFPSSNYTYAVAAVDTAGNESALTAGRNVRTLDVPSWAGIEIEDYGSMRVNTGQWMGHLWIEHAPWLWHEEFGSWVYAPDPGDVRQRWIYVHRDENLPANDRAGWGGLDTIDGYVYAGNWLGTNYVAHSPWLWNYPLTRWIYAPDPGPDAAGAWAFIQQFYRRIPTQDWTGLDLGTVVSPGSITFADGAYSVTGGGADVWGSSDHCFFPSITLSGDFDLRVRVRELSAGSSGWTKAGLMVRSSTGNRAANAFMLYSPNGTQFQARTAEGNNTGWGNFVAGQAVPYNAPIYLRLTREGNTFTGYFSEDGIKWTRRSDAEIAMPDQVFFGLAVSSHSTGSVSTAIFDRLSILQ